MLIIHYTAKEKRNILNQFEYRTMGLLSPRNTSLTNIAPRAKPITSLVSETQYLHGLSPPSDPTKAFLKIFEASRNGLDRQDVKLWTRDQPK